MMYLVMSSAHMWPEQVAEGSRFSEDVEAQSVKLLCELWDDPGDQDERYMLTGVDVEALDEIISYRPGDTLSVIHRSLMDDMEKATLFMITTPNVTDEQLQFLEVNYPDAEFAVYGRGVS